MLAFAAVWACGFDYILREYLNVRFWMPLTKGHQEFEKPNVRRIDAAFAGMTAAGQSTPLARLRELYQQISAPSNAPLDLKPFRDAVAAARGQAQLTAKEREEISLIDAKIDMRANEFETSKRKLQEFLGAAKTPEYLSEAHGWLAYVHHLLGEESQAGKIYLDELNREGSNLSREALLNSLYIVYGHQGRGHLLEQLEDYFDTPEHAAFAIQVVTNPDAPSAAHHKVWELIQQHADLLRSNQGSSALALLSMRAALRMGDPAAALQLAGEIPTNAPIREVPDFLWMLGSAHFLSRDYAAAIVPLRALFDSRTADLKQRSTAAYGLTGVYGKLGDRVEQLRYALWMRSQGDEEYAYVNVLEPAWNGVNFDISVLLDTEASREDLEAFLAKYPNADGVRRVQYALAVRLSREQRYDEAAALYQSIRAVRRAPRLRRLAALYNQTKQADLTPPQRFEAKYAYAKFLADNENGILFNDSLWHGFQTYALNAGNDVRLNRAEREALMTRERALRDEQEEYWQAYQVLQEVVNEAGNTTIGRRAALLAIHCLDHIATYRFGREDEIKTATADLVRFLKR